MLENVFKQRVLGVLKLITYVKNLTRKYLFSKRISFYLTIKLMFYNSYVLPYILPFLDYYFILLGKSNRHYVNHVNKVSVLEKELVDLYSQNLQNHHHMNYSKNYHG